MAPDSGSSQLSTDIVTIDVALHPRTEVDAAIVVFGCGSALASRNCEQRSLGPVRLSAMPAWLPVGALGRVVSPSNGPDGTIGHVFLRAVPGYTVERCGYQ